MPAPTSKTAAVREWALDQGFEVSDRGRLPGTLHEAYERATRARTEGATPPGPERSPGAARTKGASPEPPRGGAVDPRIRSLEERLQNLAARVVALETALAEPSRGRTRLRR